MSELNLAVTASLVTLIWLVQLLHYPSFQYYDPETFGPAMVFHQNRISWVVIPLMFTELGLSLLSAWTTRTNLSFILLSIVLSVWLVTFLIQVPQHQKLLHGKDQGLIRKLILGNWIRTALWSTKLLIIAIN